MSSVKDLEFNNHFLNQVVFHMIKDDSFIQKIRTILPIEIFKSSERKKIVSIIFDYFDCYKKAPKDNFYDLFIEQEESLPTELYNRCIDYIGLLKNIKNSNKQYILDSINKAIYHFRLEDASVEMAFLIKNKKYEEAKSTILKALKQEETQIYYDFFKDKEYIKDRIEQNILMTTGIDKLDNIVHGIEVPWLVVFLGGTGSGKSWMLSEMAIQATMQGLNVLYVSLEMGKKQVDARLDMMIGFLSSNPKDKKNIYDINKVSKNRQKLKKISNGNLKIIASNRGRVNYHDIENIIGQLEETEGFYTDVLIVDYLGLIKETEKGQSKKERISENCLGLKELCGTKHMTCITAMQGNRAAMSASVFHAYLVADDIDTIFHSDLAIAICQTKKEETENKYRLYIAKFRHGPQKGQFGCERDFSHGQVVGKTYDIKEQMEQKDIYEEY